MAEQQAVELKNKGNQAFKAHRYEEAVQFFTQAIQLNPNDHVYYSNRSGAYLNNKQYQEAFNDAETCIKMKPEWPRGYHRKGTALYYLEDLEEAVNTYKEGLTKDPNNAELLKSLKDVEGKLEQGQGQGMGGQGQDMNAMMQMYMKLMNNPETKDLLADPTFLPILQTIMGNPAEAYKYMGDPRVQKLMAALQGGMSPDEMKKAEEFVKKTKGSAPQAEEKPESSYTAPPPPPPKREQPKPEKMDVQEPAEMAKNKGNQQFKSKNFHDALNFYEEAIQLNPNEPLYYNNKAAAYIQINELDHALEEIAKAEKLFEEGVVKDFVKKAKVLARKGTILGKQGKWEEAITALEKSLVEDGNPKVKDDLTKFKKNKKDKDAKEYINPELAEQHNEQGAALYKEGKFPQALKEYEEAVKRNPEVAKYYSNIGQVYIKLIDFQRAKENYQLALKKDPNYQKAYHKKGDCHFFLKEYHKALETYDIGLKKDPSDKFCEEGVTKTQAAIYMGSNEGDQQERAKRAMADPEIQQILNTPEVRNALSELQRDPKSVQNIMKDPSLAAKIDKLIQAGVLRTG